MVYLRSYARFIEDLGRKEQWHETVERVVNGCFSMQYDHCSENNLPWFKEMKEVEAMRMYDKMFTMKFLPPGRGLWAMGTPLISEKKLFAALNNCAFVSTDVQEVEELLDSFRFLMDSSMLGIGFGFDTKAKGRFHAFKPISDQ